MPPTDRLRNPSPTPPRHVLVSGAGVAGLTLAYWLNRQGLRVTVVEKAATPRRGGYPVDVRGTAVEVVRRMGVLPRLRDAHVDLRRLIFLDGDGREVASLDPHTITGGVAGDLEVPRGDLTAVLHTAVRDDVELLYDDSIDTLDETGDGVDVTFHRGSGRTFDLVFGADGLHSRTRALLFGPEERFHHYLGYCFAGFTLRDTFGLAHETVLWNTPGRAAALYAAGDTGEMHALLAFARPEPPFDLFREPRAQRDLVTEVFADAGWRVPDILTALRAVDDLYFDGVSQIRMPSWSGGRVALVGDAAYAPSFLTGQGTSLALVGAYMLAASLSGRHDHATSYAAYEQTTREFVTVNQNQVGKGDATLFPTTAESLARRNDMLRALAMEPSGGGRPARPAHSALTLPASASASVT
ncbi:FAD-dependent monooxygenase [Streptomyces ossamyceticus]|uniref:FAD-dependent monooxygenase n=1 Tax=Streptomyces ossamyceticus TaxID=249581 RepID=A0ABV2VDC8_9ACTN